MSPFNSKILILKKQEACDKLLGIEQLRNNIVGWDNMSGGI